MTGKKLQSIRKISYPIHICIPYFKSLHYNFIKSLFILNIINQYYESLYIYIYIKLLEG